MKFEIEAESVVAKVEVESTRLLVTILCFNDNFMKGVVTIEDIFKAIKTTNTIVYMQSSKDA